jgi:hypothetical protein
MTPAEETGPATTDRPNRSGPRNLATKTASVQINVRNWPGSRAAAEYWHDRPQAALQPGEVRTSVTSQRDHFPVDDRTTAPERDETRRDLGEPRRQVVTRSALQMHLPGVHAQGASSPLGPFQVPGRDHPGQGLSAGTSPMLAGSTQ